PHFATTREGYSSSNEYHSDNSTSLHLHSWKCALELIDERPVFGYGTGAEVERLAVSRLAADGHALALCRCLVLRVNAECISGCGFLGLFQPLLVRRLSVQPYSRDS